MSEILTLASALAKASIPRDLSDEIARTLVAIVATEAKAVEDRMNRDTQAAVDRATARFEATVRDQTRWLAIILFSSVGIGIGGVALLMKVG